MARRNLLDFTLHTFPNYIVNWHHVALCEALDRWSYGDIDNLMVFMPPQRGKSELVSRRLPAYLFGRNPNEKIIAASYAATLIESMNRDCQNIMDDDPYRLLFPDTSLSGSNIKTLTHGNYLRNSTEFQIVGHSGNYKCAGVGGGLTGRGFKKGIIDDPVKDALEAESAVHRERVWEWYTKVFCTRKAPDAKELVTMTRWHEDDLSGRILLEAMSGEDAKHWHVLFFSEIKEDSHDILEMAEKSEHITVIGQEHDKRSTGEALWPDVFGLQQAKQQRKVMGARGFSALYQQRPSPAGGDVFKREWFNYYHIEGDEIVFDEGRIKISLLLKYGTVDLAASLKETADYFVDQIWGATRTQLFMLDQVHDRVGGDRIIPILKQMSLRYYPCVQWVEKVGFQLAIIQQAQDAGVLCREYVPKGDKLARAYAAAPMMEQRKVYFNRDAPYLTELEHELLSFPGGAHDDQVDCLTEAVVIHNETLYAGSVAPMTGTATKQRINFKEVVSTQVSTKQDLRRRVRDDRPRKSWK